ncbi:MAG: chromosome segregation protein SMC [Pseudomonadota bacterium]|nr:chromosome segregation protein SMC [Pseudomonadota bacterium]MDP1904851.1 chromosome segregation protein SMC [Pseudomonadota bacterium]MDP2354334.1 chromosome segregation protein SMC [Pseudomonadota bacterium]
MRLKHIHIAGFKSFVDPVTLPAGAQLTGIVGPNGCGKSNVIDAVRWVLGESKARELRGASMQDVIFNGSSGRKPASRASVELLFDNSAGKAAGQWSQYAEIAVKRMLTRSGDSSYWVNNVQVRKRDMADLFLGTGLGGDAYAIIEQGMISRIIEAKPEELRGFLEEAAGVSKYKERRKETEYRLRDTRENLDRVSDIREELGRQLEKLGVQAEVARRFFGLDTERTLKTRFLSLTRKREAQARQAELTRQMEAARNEIEAKTAELRRLEATLEQQRLDQFNATEALNQAQAHFYAESGEVARVEQELRHLHGTRERLAREIQQADDRQAATVAEREAAAEESELRRAELEQAEEQAEILSERAAQASDNLPEVDAAWRASQAAVAEVQRDMAQLEQAAQVEEANAAHAERAINQLKARELRLMREQEQLAENDAAEVERRQMDLETEQERVERLREYLETARAEWPQQEARLRQARQAQEAANRELHRLEAEAGALKKLQHSTHQAESGGAIWLKRLGLDSVPRLWQRIRVEAGWETAVEAALGDAMAALAVEAEASWAEQPPEARFELLLPFVAPPSLPASRENSRLEAGASGEGDMNPLADLIHTDDPLIARFLADRLALAWATDTLQHAIAQRASLPPGGFIATREGHRVSRDSLIFNAPEKAHQGLIARAREIERLEETLELALASVEAVAEEVVAAESTQQTARRQGEALQAQVAQAQNQVHELQVNLVRVQEAARRVAERRAGIELELNEVYAQLGVDEEAWNDASERQREASLQHDEARERLDVARAARQAAEQKLHGVRESLRQAEREAQEAAFLARSLTARLKDLDERKQRAAHGLQDLAQACARLQAELDQAQESPALAALDTALAKRQTAEITLTAAREALEGANGALREFDSARIACERALEPLREREISLELKLQEARLGEARFGEELEGVDEAELEVAAQTAAIAAKSEAWLKSELGRLEAEISGLGPVNMAALDELTAARERKQYLDAQAEDLETAANTLEEAIRRIDAETRIRLKETYDKVSREFKVLFTELFGGGEAQLTLTGDEILDAGLTVLAQPPGKKNSSIHLLSGGEKALTALSLVFAFFRLNPAPFCLLDEVDAPLDDSNTERYCALVSKMSAETQFLFITHNRITMEMAHNLIGVTMPEPGVSRPVAVDVEDAVRMAV